MYRITREGTFAYNRETKERMQKPKWPDYREYAHDSEWYPAYYRYLSAMKVWDAFVKALPAEYAYKRPNLIHATEKGVPVPGLRGGGRRKYKNGAGVSANSRVLSHHYRDEGERGQAHRREIKRKERALWLREWQEERENQGDPYGYDWTDYLRLTDPQDYAWDNSWEDVPLSYYWYFGEQYCETCNGPCEL